MTTRMTVFLGATLVLVTILTGTTRADVGTVSEICGTAAGTRFNLEPRVNATVQGAPSVDFLRNRVSPGVDLVVGAVSHFTKGGQYDVNRDADCAPEFEGTLPPLPDAFDPSTEITVTGIAVVRADSARGSVFLAAPYGFSSVALFRTTGAKLVDSVACPDGRHNRAQVASCWPTRILVSPAIPFSINSNPTVAVDERPTGPGAGNVYVVLQQFSSEGTNQLVLVSCKNNLSACSAPVVLLDEGFGFSFQLGFAEVSVRPDGRPSVTWIKRLRRPNDPAQRVQEIVYLSCTAVTAPATPICSAPKLVRTEKQSLTGSVVAQGFGVATHPKHDHRMDANGIETYVTWERCKVAHVESPHFGGQCPDTDLVMIASRDDGTTWSPMVCVDCSFQHQHLSAIRTDRSRNIVSIAYYSSEPDTVFQARLKVTLAQIDPGPVTPDPVATAHQVTTLLTDPRADRKCPSCFGSIGVMARGSGADGDSRAYIHFIFNSVQGTYNGIKVPDANNHLGRVDY